MPVEPDSSSIQLDDAIERLENLKAQIADGTADDQSVKLAKAISTSVLSILKVRAWE